MCSPDPVSMMTMVASMKGLQESAMHQRDAAENQARLERLAGDRVKIIPRSTCLGCGAPVQRHEESCSYCKRPA